MDSAMIYTAYAWAGWVLTTLILGALWFATGYLGMKVFNRLLRIYHLETIGYWLQKMEDNGTHIVRREAIKARDEAEKARGRG